MWTFVIVLAAVGAWGIACVMAAALFRVTADHDVQDLEEIANDRGDYVFCHACPQACGGKLPFFHAPPACRGAK